MGITRRNLLKSGVAGTTAFTIIPFEIPSAFAACLPTVWNLTAGQTTDVGSLTVTNDAEFLYVEFLLDFPGATFGTLHLWVGDDILNVPANPQGTPVPGQFPYSVDATGETKYEFKIPLSDLSIQDIKTYCGKPLYVVAHAEVTMPDSAEDGHETAFGGPEPGGGPRWWFYGIYSICCDFTTEVPPVCTTAFGRLGLGETYESGADHVFVTDKKSNPEKLPTLSLTKNRWGWAINLTAPGTYSGPIWAGAGLNNTGNPKAKNVGTLTIVWDGLSATVTYSMFTTAPKAILTEVHVYASDVPPTNIAPGQYGYTAYFDSPPDTPTTDHTVNIDVADGNNLWVIAHAVVCYKNTY